MNKSWIAVVLILIAGAMSQPSFAASNRLDWTVQDELDVFGYIVYRAEHRAGPYLRVSSKIIRRQQTQDLSAVSYTFADDTVNVGATYYYFIDVISVNGIKQRLSGVLSKKVKDS